MKADWVPSGMGNDLLRLDGYTISYNPCPGMGFSFFEADEGGDETAIIAGGKYFILNGDFRERYESFSDLNTCLQFFLSMPDLMSSWSNSQDDARSLLQESA